MINKLIQSAYAVDGNTISRNSITILSDTGVRWVLEKLGRENETEGVLQDARRMAGEAPLYPDSAMNRYALEKALGSRFVRKEWVTLEWVLDFSGLSYGNLHEYEVEDGVLEVEVRCLKEESIKADFILKMEETIYEDSEGPYRHARIHFSLPLPECITSDGEADFNSLCDKAAGPDEIVFWDEMLAVEATARRIEHDERNMAEFLERHRRTLSAAGDM